MISSNTIKKLITALTDEELKLFESLLKQESDKRNKEASLADEPTLPPIRPAMRYGIPPRIK